MKSLRVWDETRQIWVDIMEGYAKNGFATVKINDIYLEAEGPNDILQILNGDHISVLPNQNYDSIVITVNDIGSLANLLTNYKTDLVGVINEVYSKALNHGYIHSQILSNASWSIEHNLNRFPSVTIIDSGNNVVIGDVQYIDNNNITISFASEFSGKAYLN